MSNNSETQTIYDIFRACRLCGAGGGYKMPIIPSVVGIECTDIELRQKIRECVQIEVNQDDKMPPLVCELCVDKVNDFYEFLEMCRQTNRQTRIRLGLPPQNLQPSTEAPDCILGVTEQIYDQDDEPLSCATKMKIKKEKKDSDKKKDGDKRKDNEKRKENERNKENSRIKSLRKELENLVMNDISPESRSAKRPGRQESPFPGYTPGPASRRSCRPSPPTEDPPLSRISFKPQKKKETEEPSSRHDKPGPRRFKEAAKSSESPKPKPKLKMESKPILIDSDDDAPLTPRVKRPLTKAERKQEQMMETMQPPVKKYKPSSKQPTEDKAQSQLHFCSHCDESFKTRAALVSHCRFLHPHSHKPTTDKPGKTKKEAGENKQEQRRETDNKREQRKESDGSKRELRKRTEISKREQRRETDSSKRELRKETDTNKRELRKETDTSKREQRRERDTSKREQRRETDFSKWDQRKEADTSKSSKIEFRESSPGGYKAFTCKDCDKCYQTKFGLKRHIDKWHQTKSGVTTDSKVKIPPAVLERLLPAKVLVPRCDALVAHKRERYSVRGVPQDFGFDTSCVYPYRSLVRVKREPLASDFMVSINQDIKNEFYREEDYVHWDSDLSSDSDDEFPLLTPGAKKKKIPSLTKLSLKTLFSKRCLGKVPRKLRKVKKDEKFDSLFNTEFDDMQSDINKVIDNLGDTINRNVENDAVNDDKAPNSEMNAATTEEANEKVPNGENSAATTEETNENGPNCENNAVTIKGNDDTVSIVDDKASNIDDNYINSAKVDKNDDNGSIYSFNTNGEVNYESDSLLGNGSRVEKTDSDTLKYDNVDNAKSNDNVSYTLSMHESEIDASVDAGEIKLKSQSTTDEDSSQEEETTQNGFIENGVRPNALIDEIDDLIGEKNIMDEIDEQIYGIDSKIGAIEKKDHVNATERGNEITLDDLGEKSGRSMDLDSISDGEFNFDA